MYETELVEPIHAESFFSVSHSGEVHERLMYEYMDHDGYYNRILQDETLFEEEIQKLATNMQYFLDKERVEINSVKVKSEVNYADIFPKGNSSIVGVLFLIDFGGRFSSGVNKVETWIEEEVAEYDFEIIWRFPRGTEIIGVETLLEYEIYEDLIVLWAVDGQEVGGYERMEFKLPDDALDTRSKNTSPKSMG